MMESASVVKCSTTNPQCLVLGKENCTIIALLKLLSAVRGQHWLRQVYIKALLLILIGLHITQ